MIFILLLLMSQQWQLSIVTRLNKIMSSVLLIKVFLTVFSKSYHTLEDILVKINQIVFFFTQRKSIKQETQKGVTNDMKLFPLSFRQKITLKFCAENKFGTTLNENFVRIFFFIKLQKHFPLWLLWVRTSLMYIYFAECAGRWSWKTSTISSSSSSSS